MHIAQCTIDKIFRIFLLLYEIWKELHQAKNVKYIGKKFPPSNTNIQMTAQVYLLHLCLIKTLHAADAKTFAFFFLPFL